MSLNQIQVQSIPNTSAPDGGPPVTAMGGKANESVVTELHGKWYTAGYRGRIFHASSPIAGQVIPVITSTTAQTALSLFNPLGSGVNLELISFRFGTSITTTVWDRRATLHHAQLVEHLTQSDPVAAQAFSNLNASGFGTD